MAAEEIRQKAIEEHHFIDASILVGYEHGFADGVKEGKRLAIKHAHWTPTEYNGYADGNPVWDVYTCSACGDEHYGESGTLTDFCPCCGARMDEEGEEETT